MSLISEKKSQEINKGDMRHMVREKLENADKKMQGFQVLAIRNKKTMEVEI